MTGAAAIRWVKVFGERNTGTNFAEQLVALNHPGLGVLRHGTNDGLEQQAAAFGSAMAPLVLERLIDARRAAEFPRNFGWKHAATTPAMLESAPIYPETVFLFITRNPFQFLASLWRRPYNVLMPGGRPGDRSTFLRRPILANQRDGLAEGLIANPVRLWSLKTGAHMQTAAALGDRALLVRYEDLVEAPDLASGWLARHGHPANGPLKVPARSTKGDALTFQDYRDRVRNHDPGADFPAPDRRFIREQLDGDLCGRLDYAGGPSAV